ncbi:MAG: chemotaxis protein CheX [Betaproteobacteria bacterium]|jgi:chemotaxis protein CheX|nr:chemotaxis protein CheX [Betaproteobacteria bacterium]
MSRRNLRAADIRVFSEAVRDFFAATTSESAEVRSAYVLEGDEAILWNDYNGLIEVDGGFSGCIAFSAPRGLLSHVLLRMGDQEFSDANHCDIVGEIANILSGSARRHFGEGLRISTPTALPGRGPCVPRPADRTAYAIPLRWNGYEADLVINLESCG